MCGCRTRWSLFAFGLVLVLTPSAWTQQKATRSGQSDDATYEKVVNDFIRFDIGQVRDPIAAEHIKARFAALRSDDAVPALVAGLNSSTRMRASCPITAISGKLRSIVSASKNPDVGTFLLQNLERNNVGPYTMHVNSLFDVAETQVARTMGNGLAEQQFRRRSEEGLQRLAHTPGLRITELPDRDAAESSNRTSAREKRRDTKKVALSSTGEAGASSSGEESGATPATDWSRLGVSELTERLSDRPSQLKALVELSRRAGEAKNVSEASDAIVQCLADGDDSTREAAARLLGLVRSQRAVPTLIDALDDRNAKVRSAAATALARTTRQLFGPNDGASPEERQIAITRWRDWWNRQSKNSANPTPG